MDENKLNEEVIKEPTVEIIEEKVEKPTKIKKYLEKPGSRKEKRKKMVAEMKYEKAFTKRSFKARDKKPLKVNILIGLVITFALIMLFRYVLNIDMTVVLNTFLRPSLGVTAGIILISMIILLIDKTKGISESDPITDYFIINRGKISGKTKDSHLSKINTRFMMVTLLKLYKKDQIAIVNERIIYGTMDGHLSKDEVALLNFMLDHSITTVDEFIQVITDEQKGKKHGILTKRDHLYGYYKEAILEMAKEKHYINQSINKSKLILRAGALFYGIIVIALVAKGQGSLEMIGVFSAQAIILFLIAHIAHAHSRGAHMRIAQLRKERKLIRSQRADIYTALIYNYLFGKEEKSIKRIQKKYESGEMSRRDYSKFSETYNGFNFILSYIKKEN